MTSIKDFQIVCKLGEGAYSSVYKVKRLADNIEYALKKVKLMNLSEKEKQNALNEVRILASIRHPNIVGYKEVFIDDASNSLCIVMEFVNNGDLYQKILEHQKKGSTFNENEIWIIFIQIVKGLKALHDLQILHRDLKSANVFLNKDNTVKLGDMNVSKVAKKGLLYTQTGTPYYASPEVWKDQPYDYKSDMWSLGCVLYEMATLKPPFRAENMEGLYKKVIRGYYPRIPNQYSQDLNNVIRALLQIAPHLRPNCDKILQFPALIKRMEEKHFTELDEANSNFLLNTIRIPKNIHYLTDRLPKPNYAPLKTKKIDKKRFLQTLAGYQEIEEVGSQYESIRNSMPELPTHSNNHLPKLKYEEKDRESSINGKINSSGNNNEDSFGQKISNKAAKHKKNELSIESRKEMYNNNDNSKEDYRLPMILQNNNVRLNIEGNRISNLVKNSINEISVIKNMDKNSKIKELTKLYRVQKAQMKKERPYIQRNISLPHSLLPEIKQMS